MPAAERATPMPLSAEDEQALATAIAGYDERQLLWASGYLAGLAAGGGAPAAAVPPAASARSSLTVFYASETGNSRRLAEALAREAAGRGGAAEVVDLARFKPRQLGKVGRALFVVATHGLGDPPEGTERFFEYWLGDDAPRLESLSYGVLALGDSSYADFCEAGRRLDDALERLGATRLLPRVDCDVDYAADARRWSDAALEQAIDPADAAPAGRARLRAVPAAPAVSRERPYTATILANQRITGTGSSKDVRHVELDIEDAGIDYLPGDSLGIHPVNPPRIVDAVLAAGGLDGDAQVSLGDESLPLARALAERLEITAPSRPLLDALAAGDPALAARLADREALRELLATRQVGDLLHETGAPLSAQALVDALRRLPPRLYSIASGPDANPGEVHVTVGVVDYRRYGRPHWGSASGYLADAPAAVPVYVEPNPQFRLPDDGSTPLIMIGAGTGVAPYRAFVEQRREHGHDGSNWLIFGDRNFASDFLYQAEWLQHRKDGYLAHLDVAFSRDQADKVYVQHRIREHGRRFLDWLERGAHVYVCGDATAMAADVQAAILDVFREQGGLSADAAAEKLAGLRTAGRYQRDVY